MRYLWIHTQHIEIKQTFTKIAIRTPCLGTRGERESLMSIMECQANKEHNKLLFRTKKTLSINFILLTRKMQRPQALCKETFQRVSLVSALHGQLCRTAPSNTLPTVGTIIIIIITNDTSAPKFWHFPKWSTELSLIFEVGGDIPKNSQGFELLLKVKLTCWFCIKVAGIYLKIWGENPQPPALSDSPGSMNLASWGISLF